MRKLEYASDEDTAAVADYVLDYIAESDAVDRATMTLQMFVQDLIGSLSASVVENALEQRYCDLFDVAT